ncbi:MAG: cell division protein ZapA [Calditrichaeota bacterium]|nr:cell division protein ZapA [Calditrichota bacterium]
MAESIEVTIYGQSYNLRTDNDQRGIIEVAQVIDQKMRDLASKLSMSSTAKLAILAALNLIYELKNDQSPSISVSGMEKSIDAMISEIEHCLEH